MSFQITSDPPETQLPQSAQRQEQLSDILSDDALLSEDHVIDAHTQLDIPLRIGDVQEEEGDESDEEPGDRPNRYYGPAQTWRNWTVDERGDAGTLEQLTARDLAVHLYNSHGLRARARRLRVRFGDRNDDREGERPAEGIWEPPAWWAAWPMDANTVPRDVHGIVTPVPKHEVVYRTLAPPLSSRQALEELIISVASRKARERFRNRKWGDSAAGPQGSDDSDYMEDDEDDDSENQDDATEKLSDDSADSTAETSAKPRSKSHSTSPFRSTSRSRSKSKSRGTALSRPTSELSSRGRSRSSKRDDRDAPNMDPVPIADDALVAGLLRKPTRHVLSLMDSLLLGLHHSRMAVPTYHKQSAAANSESEDDEVTEDEEMPDDEEHRSALGRNSRSRSMSRRRKRARSTSISSSGSNFSSDLSSEETASPSPQPSLPARRSRAVSRGRRSVSRSRGAARSSSRRSSQSSTNRHRMREGLRDWSDVLGMAAIAGFAPEVVRRAQRRCEALFGERMDFVDVDTLGMAQQQGQAGTEEARSEDEMEAGVHVDGFMRPIKKRQGWRGKDSKKRDREGYDGNDNRAREKKLKGVIEVDGTKSGAEPTPGVKKPRGRPRKITRDDE